MLAKNKNPTLRTWGINHQVEGCILAVWSGVFWFIFGAVKFNFGHSTNMDLFSSYFRIFFSIQSLLDGVLTYLYLVACDFQS